MDSSVIKTQNMSKSSNTGYLKLIKLRENFGVY